MSVCVCVCVCVCVRERETERESVFSPQTAYSCIGKIHELNSKQTILL